MNYLEDYVIYYNVWLSRNIPFYKINYFQKAQVDNNYTKDHDRWRSQFNTNYRLIWSYNNCLRLTVLEPVSFTHAELSKIS